ncbi:amino acid adenylation domain-containing protein [Amycolatopsis sp. NPDC059657]|uniref:non-ribosomal peptide synthetase n=1 Tax=Amycolatopsis sp. NPDC059657 TaxID=3346899 RepID=UPI003670BBE3
MTGLSTLTGPVRRLPRGHWWEPFTTLARTEPALIGLVADEVAWSFGDLDLWSTRLAHSLREAGARRGTVVACAMQRSVRAILGLFAVAKAGAIYLPIDPGQPAAHLDTILDDAKPAVLLTDVTALAARADVVLSPDNWQAELARHATTPLPVTPPDGPAYVIYTSGSTGRPKGVVVGNRSLVNLHRELAARFFRLRRGRQRVAHGMPFAFDASWNPLLWLVGGHEVHLVPTDVRADPELYLRFIRDHRLSVVEAVPAHVSALIRAGLLDGEIRPRLLLMGGEAVSQTLWSRLRAVPDLVPVNLYGPTECTVFTTACRVDRYDSPAIGVPIGNTSAQVVDAGLRPVPVGVPGELLISGDCVALGYLGKPELTAEKFVAGSYRTGDLCRCLPDARLQWLGRLDDQVKIRGHRVEPGAVEHTVLKLPGVRQAVVQADADRLIAYVVLDHDTAEDLHRLLRLLLPDYLVPSAVIALDALPLGPNGKVDRAALRPDVPARLGVLTPSQDLVAGLFRDVLGVPAVTADSDFFALGGHSLTAAVLAGRLRACGVRCTLRDVLLRPTVAQLAELVEGM